jgi:hypothetical protein
MIASCATSWIVEQDIDSFIVLPSSGGGKDAIPNAAN